MGGENTLANKKFSLFEDEENFLNEAKNLINSGEYDNNPLLEQYHVLTCRFGNMLREFKKIVRISDNQHEHLQHVQNDMKKEISDRIRAEEELKHLATTDAMTGAYNRGAGLSLLRNQLMILSHKGSFFSMCYIDINGLKYVNDSFGHFEGDELLIIICNCIKGAIRDDDILFRMGGDEFMIVFPDCTKRSAETIIKRIIVDIAAEGKKQQKPYPISFSYGTVQVDADNEKPVDELIEIADKRMYEHKKKMKES